MKVSVQEYIDSSFPVGGKRTRSAVIRKEVAQRIVNHLKGTPDADAAFRHFVKKSGFALVDLQSVGIETSGANPFTMMSSTFFLANPPPPSM